MPTSEPVIPCNVMALRRALTTLLLLAAAAATTAVSDGGINDFTMPEDRAQLESWWNQTVRPINERWSSLDPAVVAAEKNGITMITVRKDGTGNFRTVTEAVNSIPAGNERRVVIIIGPGEYHEKVTVEASQKFVTFYGSPDAMPVLTFAGTALQYGTVDSGTLTALADYFVGANLIIKNSAPRPDGKRKGAQATALRVSGDKSAFYNCRLIGFQDTLCDDRGNHLFKDCYIEGTVDFIFGSGTSLYLNTELHVLGDGGMTVIAAQARESETENTGYSFVHCSVTGSGGQTYLARAWQSRPRVVYAFTNMSDAINPAGWSDNGQPERRSTVFYGEYKNTGVGASKTERVSYSKELIYDQVKTFISLGYINGSTWLLPAPRM